MLYTPNLTMSQTELVKFGLWSRLEYMRRNQNISQIDLDKFGTFDIPNLTVQTYLGQFGIWSSWDVKCPKLDRIPNLSRSIWDMVKFGAFDIPNLTMSQTYLGRSEEHTSELQSRG